MHTTIDDHQVEQDERCAGIAEDRLATHPTIEARHLAEAVVALFERDTPSLWNLVADSLTADPERLDITAQAAGLPRPTDAVKATTISLIRSKALSASLSPIPPVSQRPVCVTVAWLAEHPGHAAQLVYRAGDAGWLPAADAVHCIDPEWCVEIRQALHMVGA